MRFNSWRSRCFFVALAAAAVLTLRSTATQAQNAPAFQLVDGDRVVMLGSTFIERDQAHGYLEAALTTRCQPAHIQFRNLGWSGDNVFGEARAAFGTVADGYNHLKEHVLALKPTVILLGYGTNESFAGAAGLKTFEDGLATLLATLDKTKARIVFISPVRQEDLGRPLPDPAAHNKDLKLYVTAIAKVAAARQAPFVNLYDLLPMKSGPSGAALTDNGLHLTAYGYWRAAPVIEQALGLAPRRWQIEADVQSQNVAARGVTIREARFAPGVIRFEALDQTLPLAAAPSVSTTAATQPERIVRVFNLPPGQYALSIGDMQVALASAERFAAGVAVAAGPDFEQADELRRAILDKNQLYFHRWRPQNETYLFGFRKHEQGNNAVEIPQFDPLVEAQEKLIHKLAAPVARHYELVKVDTK